MEQSTNAGCDNCGMDDRAPKTTLCATCQQEAHEQMDVGQSVPGGTMLAQSTPFAGDGVGRPYVVRLVVRHQRPHPYVVWVYFTDATDRAYGDYCATLPRALDAYKQKCARWNVQPNLEGA